jgi:hypothetical protein
MRFKNMPVTVRYLIPGASGLAFVIWILAILVAGQINGKTLLVAAAFGGMFLVTLMGAIWLSIKVRRHEDPGEDE